MKIIALGFIASLLCFSGCATTNDAPANQNYAMPAAAKWTKTNTVPYKGKQDDIYFINQNTGWYGNGAGKIYKTTDGGNTWVEKLNKPGTFFRTIGFIDDKIGFAGNIGIDYFPGVTDTTPMYVTEDGGETWAPLTDKAKVDGPIIKGLCAIDILRTQFINAGYLDTRVVIHAAGRVGGPAMLMRSLDGGKTWKTQDLSQQAGMILDIKFFDESTGFIFAASSADTAKANALILMTTDGGTTWSKRYQSSRPFELTWKASFPTRKVGYATIQNYDPDKTKSQRYVAKTTDGGLSWQEIPLVDDHSVRQFGVGFINENIGWVGAIAGGYQTLDGGKNWTPAALGRGVNKIRVLEKTEGGFVAYAIGLDVYKWE